MDSHIESALKACSALPKEYRPLFKRIIKYTTNANTNKPHLKPVYFKDEDSYFDCFLFHCFVEGIPSDELDIFKQELKANSLTKNWNHYKRKGFSSSQGADLAFYLSAKATNRTVLDHLKEYLKYIDKKKNELEGNKTPHGLIGYEEIITELIGNNALYKSNTSELDLKTQSVAVNTPTVVDPDPTIESNISLGGPSNLASSIHLEVPISSRDNIHFFANETTKMYGRAKEKKILLEFIYSNDRVSWLQIAGASGQGKSRLALDIAKHAILDGWNAGFLDEEDLQDVCERWSECDIDRPHLFIIDDVMGREFEARVFFKALFKRRPYNYPIRVILIEQQPWNEGGYLRPRFLEKTHLDIVDKSILEMAFTDRNSNAIWFRRLCFGKQHTLYSKVEAQLENTRFSNGVLELAKLSPSETFSICRAIYWNINKKRLKFGEKKKVLRKLNDIDPETRALYAHFYGELISFNEDEGVIIKERILDLALRRQREKYIELSFLSKDLAAWAHDCPGLRLAALATITSGVDCKLLHSKNLFEMQPPEVRLQAMMLTSTPISTGDPGTIISPLRPYILGDWMVLDSINNYLPVQEIMDIAWSYNPVQTLIFLSRITDNFPEHVGLREAYCFWPSRDITWEDIPTHYYHKLLLELCFKNINITSTFIQELIHQAEQAEGDSIIYLILGRIYETGVLIKKEHQKALFYYEKASEENDSFSMYYMASLLRGGEEIEANAELSNYWFQKSADLGNEYSMLNLASNYSSGVGIDQNNELAALYLEKAINTAFLHGSQNAFTRPMGLLGTLYQAGFGVSKDFDKSKFWFQKAVDRGDSLGMLGLGLMYYHGQKVKQDYKRAKDLFQKSSDKGNHDALALLGACYSNGHGVEQDQNIALELFIRSASHGCGWACDQLRIHYESGDLCRQEYEAVISQYRQFNTFLERES